MDWRGAETNGDAAERATQSLKLACALIAALCVLLIVGAAIAHRPTGTSYAYLLEILVVASLALFPAMNPVRRATLVRETQAKYPDCPLPVAAAIAAEHESSVSITALAMAAVLTTNADGLSYGGIGFLVFAIFFPSAWEALGLRETRPGESLGSSTLRMTEWALALIFSTLFFLGDRAILVVGSAGGVIP